MRFEICTLIYDCPIKTVFKRVRVFLKKEII